MSQYFAVHPRNPQPRLIRQAAEIVRGGGVIAYPTDSCYALGCHLDDKAAVNRIRAIRGLDDSHHMSLMVRDLAEIARFAKVDNRAYRPGPLSPFKEYNVDGFLTWYVQKLQKALLKTSEPNA